jgi:hypothetical protein
MPVEVTMQLGANIFNRATEKRIELENWRNDQKAKIAEAEVLECSFKPDVKATRKRNSSYQSLDRQSTLPHS